MAALKMPLRGPWQKESGLKNQKKKHYSAQYISVCTETVIGL